MAVQDEQFEVFNSAVLTQILRKDNGRLLRVLNDLKKVENALNAQFTQMKDPILALILAAASGEPLLLVGPPGTAKSRLIRSFCALTGLIDENDLTKPHDDYFEYLLTPFTEPGELFGHYDVAQAVRGEAMVRITKGMMQEAQVVYLDEVFNGSSAILNSILSFLNERVFHDRGERIPVKMEVLFGATNQIPETGQLRAVFDRFLLRCHVGNVAANTDAIRDLLQVGWSQTYSLNGTRQTYPMLLDELRVFRHDLQLATSSGNLRPDMGGSLFYRYLTEQVDAIRRQEASEMSNRRLVKLLNVMTIHAMYRAATADQGRLADGVKFTFEELSLIRRFALDKFDPDIVSMLENQFVRS